jgi:hypothetical protein
MSQVKLKGAFCAFFIKWRYFAAFIVFRNTVTAMSTTTAVPRKKIHAEYFWSVGGSYTNNRNQIN